MKEMYKGVVNSPETTITNNISATDTIIFVLDATRLPDTIPNLMVLGNNVNAETVKVTAIDDTKLTVVRGFQGTAKSWNSGTVIARNFTAYDYDSLVDNIDELQKNKANNSKEDIVALGIPAQDTVTTINGKTGEISKEDIVELGIPAQDTVVDVVDNLTTHDATKALSAKQGKILKDDLVAHKAENVQQFENVNTQLNGIENFKSDYEYQTPTIVGRQIRVQKKSDTNILKFRLNTDISNGEQITISTNNGSTSKPLEDIDGNQITELNKGFVEVIESSVNFTLRPSGVSLEYFRAFYGESPDYGGNIYALTADNDYIYCGGSTQKVWKIRKSDMTKVSESPDYGGNIRALTADNDYIYCGGYTTRTVWKIRKSDMTKVSESPKYGGDIRALTADNDYIYCGGSTQKVWKIRKSDMTKVSESPDYGGNIYALTADNDYIYCGGSTQKVWKIRKSDMTKVSESPNYGGDIYALTADNDYIYCGGYTTRTVWKIRKSDMTKVSESPNYGGDIYALTADNDYIYCGGGSTQKVWKIRKSDMTKVSESPKYGGDIRALTADNDYIYCGGSTQKVWKIRNILQDYYKYNDLILFPMEV